MSNVFCSVVIPAFHEAGGINAVCRHVFSLPAPGEIEVLVVDGAPEADTLKALHVAGVRGVRAPAGRARQCNAGAGLARGERLLFLHADTRLPHLGLYALGEALGGTAEAGAFDLGVDSARLGLRVVAAVASLRSRWTRVPYGDQGLFFRRETFFRFGGFPEIALMEDLELMRRLRRGKTRIAIVHPGVRTSPRRWEKEGIVRGTLRNWSLRLAYFCGVSPARLAGWYRPHGQPENS